MTARIHFDATRSSGDLLRASLCGFTNVTTTSDANAATCRMCLARLRGGKPASPRASRMVLTGASTADELADALHLALSAAPLAPSAGFSPRMSHELWQSSCKGAADSARCHAHACVLCAWEKDAALWNAVSPYNKQHQLDRPDDAPRWSSLAAAIGALVEHELHGRDIGSSLGPTLARLARGDCSDTARDPRKNAPLAAVRSHDVVHVAHALEAACASGDDALTPTDRARLLLERTAGAGPLTGVVSFEALAQLYIASEAVLRSVLRRVRAAMVDDLIGRGLLVPPRGRLPVAASTTWRSTEEASSHAAA